MATKIYNCKTVLKQRQKHSAKYMLFTSLAKAVASRTTYVVICQE